MSRVFPASRTVSAGTGSCTPTRLIWIRSWENGWMDFIQRDILHLRAFFLLQKKKKNLLIAQLINSKLPIFFACFSFFLRFFQLKRLKTKPLMAFFW